MPAADAPDRMPVCPACAGARTAPDQAFSAGAHVCHACGLGFMPAAGTLDYASAYAGDAGPYAGGLAQLDGMQTAPDPFADLLPCERRILDYADRGAGRAGFADIGCGLGRLLRAAEARFGRATGFETVPALVERLRHYGRDARPGGIGALPERSQEGFGAIALVEVLEHLGNPAAAVAGVLARQRPQALYVVVPAAMSRRRFDGNFARHDHPPNHVSWWTPAALAAALAHPGYRVAVEPVAESRTAMRRHLRARLRGPASAAGVLSWAMALAAPPPFWLLGIAEAGGGR